MTWYSQAGQDGWVRSIIGDKGFFVDVGAHDGVTHSNTYALERLGWTGICIEPNDEAFVSLFTSRSCATVNYPVSDRIGRVLFDGVRVGSGGSRLCYPLREVLNTVEAPPVVDYLSIDTEGHELAVLAGMDFERWHVRLITIEHNLYRDGPAHKDAIFDRLSALGFERVAEDVVAPGYGPFEDWYEHRDARHDS